MDKKTNAIWNYFEKLTSESAKCKLCKKCYSTKGRTNTPLINHLQSCHIEEFKKYKKIQEEKKIKNAEAKADEPPAKKQATLQNSVSTKWGSNFEKSVEIDKAVGELIALEDMPFQLVDKPAFRKLINLLQPRYNLRGRTYFTEFICENMYLRIHAKTKDILKDLRYISLTSDVWSDPSAGVSLMSLTCHGINENFERIYLPLKCKNFPGSHTGSAIANEIESLMEEWGITKSQVHCILRDGAANMKSATNIMAFENLTCVAHELQLSLKTVFENVIIKSILSKCKSVATHFSHSLVAQNKLTEIQTQLNQPILSPKQSCSTRWNSIYYMLKRFIEIRDSISLYANKNNISQISATEWSDIEALLEILEPFEQLTRWLSRSDACISCIIPYISILQSRDAADICISIRKPLIISIKKISASASASAELTSAYQQE